MLGLESNGFENREVYVVIEYGWCCVRMVFVFLGYWEDVFNIDLMVLSLRVESYVKFVWMSVWVMWWSGCSEL